MCALHLVVDGVYASGLCNVLGGRGCGHGWARASDFRCGVSVRFGMGARRVILDELLYARECGLCGCASRLQKGRGVNHIQGWT
jgi:hypothetical protein